MDLAGTEPHADSDAATRRFMEEHAPTPGERATAPVLGAHTHREIFEYWCGLPRADGMPDASDFDPIAIVGCLPDIAIVSVRSPTDIHHRLVGTGLVNRVGYDATGVNLLDLITDDNRVQCSRDMHEVVYRPCVSQARVSSHYISGRIAHAQSIYLPLRGPAGQPPRIVSIHTPEEPTGYDVPMEKPRFADHIDRVVWIDVGCGTP
ncbi:PAS domain-containing protein [Parvibaculum sp.]|uniref:PAS domain-containing protein n=1 Tax=Parvibaculum sp. TaxID=2024848 RepID=UPI0034A02862